MMDSDSVTLALAVQNFTGGRFTMDRKRYLSKLPYPGDLNAAVLEDIYTGIKKNVSETAAANFVRLVDSLEDLSADAFRSALCEFWKNGCSSSTCYVRHVQILKEQGPSAPIRADQSVLALIRRRSLLIKKPFILNHLQETQEVTTHAE